MTNSVINVVIPIYNGEKYIDGLIKTLNSQTFKNFKAIFIDDGSTDNSLESLKSKQELMQFESLIVHQENKGLPGARNTGIKSADGQWLTFMDCDDLLSPYYFEYLYKSVTENNTMVGFCKYMPVIENDKKPINYNSTYTCKVISSEEGMKAHYTAWIGSWNLIINLKWLLENNIYFDEKCTYCEDIPFVTELFEKADKISKLENELYIYVLRQGSLIRSPKIEKFMIGIDGFLRMADIVEKSNSDSAKAFSSFGRARYSIATLKKGAVQLPFNLFSKLCEYVNFKQYKHQIKNLPSSQRFAAHLFLFSKRIFFYIVKAFFDN